MAALKITAETREGTGKGVARKLRQAGSIPAVLYGQGEEAVALALNGEEVKHVLAVAGATTSILDLELKSGKKSDSKTVLIKDIQMHPYKRTVLHMDLLEVAMDQEISVNVPLKLVGEAEGLKMGGIIELKRRNLEVLCLPTSIPDALPIDVSSLEIGDVVHVESIETPEGVKIPHDVNFTILTMVGPTVEEKPEEEEEIEGEEAEAAAEEESAEEPEEAPEE